MTIPSEKRDILNFPVGNTFTTGCWGAPTSVMPWI